MGRKRLKQEKILFMKMEKGQIAMTAILSAVSALSLAMRILKSS